MDYTESKLEKLDDLPSYQSKHEVRNQMRDYRWNEDFPYRHAKRWAQSQIGKNYDKVFAEWKTLEWLPARRRDQENLDLVISRPILLNGEIVDRRWGWVKFASMRYDCVYVCPTTNIIKINKGKKKSLSYEKQLKIREAEWFRPIDATNQLIKDKGVWYLYEAGRTYLDWRLHEKIRPFDRPFSAFSSCYGKKIKQLSSKELKKYNLQNDK